MGMTEEKRRAILILGAGIMQLPAIRAAKRLGLVALVADGNPEAVGRLEADDFQHVDLRDKKAMRTMARAKSEEYRLDGVFTAGTDFSTTVAFVAESLGLPGNPYEVALNATDKSRMRRVLGAAGVPIPRFTTMERVDIERDDFSGRVEKVGLPVVVKPVDNMGARGVVRADTVAQAHEFALKSLPFSGSGRVLIEGFIDGPEFSLDALVVDGSVLRTGFADRNICFPPFFVEMGHTIPSNLDSDTQEEIWRVFEQGVQALGLRYGAAKGDMKLSPDGPVVGEIAARLSGGFMSGWTFPLSCGVPLTERALRIALGEPPGSVAPVWDKTSAERAVISIPGVIESVVGEPDVPNLPNVAVFFRMREDGTRMRFPQNNVEKVANVIATSEDREDAIRSAEEAVAAVEVILLPSDEETDRFLFGPPTGHWAYHLDPTEAQEPWLAEAAGDADLLSLLAQNRRHMQGRVERQSVALFDELDTFAERDWAHRTIAGTISMLARSLSAPERIGAGNPDRDVSVLFWRALLRGGVQGARYTLRTLGYY
jgi:biotin carboxylase